jgi:DUF971 family protein
MIPKQIKLAPNATLIVLWEDNHTSNFPLQYLRDFCPCAGCKEERAQGPPLLPILVDGKYLIRDIIQVGHYAVSIEWGDGHNLGIYSFDYLRSLCPCPEHTAASSS